MIGWLRRYLSSWAALAILGLVVIAFVITGVGTGDPFGTSGASGEDSIAKVGRDKITAGMLSQQIDRTLRNARQQNPQLDTASFVREGGVDQIVEQMISAQALESWGRQQGFVAARRLVDGEIASVQAFQVAGKFDQQTYEAALKAQRMTDRQLRQGIEGDLIRRQILVPIAVGATAPEAVVRPYAALLLEQRKGRVGFVPAAKFVPEGTPTEAQVTGFYEKNKSRYLTPETRSFRYALFGAQTVAGQTQVSDEEVTSFYNSNRDSYAAIERRSLSQVTLADKAAADALVAQVKSGKSLAEAAKARGADIVTIENRTRADYAGDTSEAVAKAAFEAPKGQVVGPVQSPFGWVVASVDSVSTTAARPLPAVTAEIRGKIAAQKRDEALSALVARIEDATAKGADFSEVVKDNGLTIVSVPAVTAQGANPAAADYRLPPEAGALLDAVFQADPEGEATVETLPQGSFALLSVEDVTPSAVAPLASIRDKVATDYVVDVAAARAKAAADAVLAKVKGGQDLSAALAAADLPAPQPAGGRRLDIAQSGQERQIPPPLAMLFALPKNDVRTLAAPDGKGWFIVKVDEIVPGDLKTAPGLLDATRSQFGRIIGEEYAGQFVAAVRQELKVTRNQTAIDAVKGRLTGAGPQ